MRTKHGFHLGFSKYCRAASHIVISQKIILVALDWNNSTLPIPQRSNKDPNFGIPHEIVNDCAELKSPVCAPTLVSHNRRQASELAIVDNRTTSFIRSIHFTVLSAHTLKCLGSYFVFSWKTADQLRLRCRNFLPWIKFIIYFCHLFNTSKINFMMHHESIAFESWR